MTNNTFKEGNYIFQRSKTFLGDDIVNVYVTEQKETIRLTTIRKDEMKRKKLDFYNDKDIIKFKKTYR